MRRPSSSFRRSKDRLEKRLHELQDRKTDDNLTFEQLGIDALIVDEAHFYKKLEFETQMDNIKGLDKGASQRSSSLVMKARHIQEKTGGRNIVLGTGTPITNTVAEIWNMMRYVRPDLLADYRVGNFDDFATAFTEPITQLEQTDTGQYRHVTRLARFTNLPELQTLLRSAQTWWTPDCLHPPTRTGRRRADDTMPQTKTGQAVYAIPHPAVRSMERPDGKKSGRNSSSRWSSTAWPRRRPSTCG